MTARFNSTPAACPTATVTVLAHEGDETFELSEAEEAELAVAISEAERDEVRLSNYERTL